ncbi:protein transport protein SEC31-like [Alosa sapidissima]|uniref:protein transport protein SEC31-like n=1 Tax=Alosa sapidissima TaxID=34773 RepID=UPI001C0894C8|nr:protein transport protein SEC31-like [Alosa sapidissima]
MPKQYSREVVVDFCRANQVEVVCLPAHTSHWTVYGSLKAAFSRLAREMGLVRGDLVLGKRHFSAVLKYAVEQACTPDTIKSGFRSTGLFPLDRTAVDDSKLVKGLREPNHLPSDKDENPEDLPDVSTADAAAHTRSATTSTANSGTVVASSTAVECAPSPVSSPWGPADPAATMITTTVPTPCSPNASSSSTTTAVAAPTTGQCPNCRRFPNPLVSAGVIPAGPVQ